MLDGLDRRAKLRIVALALLAIGFAAYNGQRVVADFLSSSVLEYEGFAYQRDADRAVVRDVAEKDDGGRPTPAAAAGLAAGDVVVSIETPDGAVRPIRGLWDHGRALARIHWNERWAINVERPLPGGGALPLRLVVPPLPRPARPPAALLMFVCVDLLLPFAALVAAALVGFSRPNDRHAFRAALLFFFFPTVFSTSLLSLGPVLREAALFARAVGPMLAVYLVFRFFISFPNPAPLRRRFPWLDPVVFGVAAVASAYRFAMGLAVRRSFAEAHALGAALDRIGIGGPLAALVNPALVAILALGVVAVAGNARAATSRGERRRLEILLAGAIVGLGPLGVAVLLASSFAAQPLWLLIVVTATVWIFPASFVYVVVRHQVFGIRVILRRGLQYTLVARGVFFLAGLFFGLLYVWLGPALARLVPEAGAGVASLGSAALALGLALGLREVNRRVMPAIDRAFFRDAYDARRILSELADAVRQRAAEPRRLLGFVADELHAALHPSGVTIFLRRDEAGWLVPAARDAAEQDGNDFCCALYAAAPNGARGGGLAQDEQALCRTAPALAALVQGIDPEAPTTIDVVPSLETTWDRLPAPPHVLRAAGPCLDAGGAFDPFDARLVVPLATRRRIVGCIVLGGKLSEEPYTREDRQLLLSVAGQAAIALDYAQLIGQAADRERVRRELEIAQEVQEALFPQRSPELATLDYIGVSRPARILGGDYFDFIDLGGRRMALALADLSGKGISAALLMASLQAALRSHAAQWGSDVAALVSDVNDQLCASTAANKFATLFYGVYDDASRRLVYVNAGHNPPLVAGPRGEIRRLTTGGMVVGVLPGQTYESESIELLPGDALVVYTDGATDAADAADEPFGEARLAELVAAHRGDSPEALRDAVLAALSRHAAGVPFEDDVSLVIAKAR